MKSNLVEFTRVRREGAVTKVNEIKITSKRLGLGLRLRGILRGTFYPSTRQDRQKMGIFFRKIRQNCVREMAGVRQGR
jgi:hypothetical protein